MGAIYFLLPVTLLLASLGVVGFRWAVRHGQLDDLEGARSRLLLDADEAPARPARDGDAR